MKINTEMRNQKILKIKADLFSSFIAVLIYKILLDLIYYFIIYPVFFNEG
jgi:hypothetical protein